jgi:RimJ/RimL family protein N-acetyltransferase
MDAPEEVIDVALWRVHVRLEDRPGRLGVVATAVGAAGCDIVSLHVVGEPSDDGTVTDELLVRVPDDVEAAALVESVRAAGIPCTLLVRADATELSDPATTALALARMVAADPGSAPRAVATMLRARLVAPDAAAQPHSHTLRVGAQQVRLGRAWPFTATELSRAAALLELAGQLGLARPSRREPDEDRILLLRDGSEIRLRTAGPRDALLVAALHARCSPVTRLARFGSPSSRLAPGLLQALLAGENGARAVLACTVDGGSAVGLVTVDPRVDDTVGFAVLVEDAWQGRGLGTSMVRRAVDLGLAVGAAVLTAEAASGDLRLTRLLRRAGLRPTAQLVGGTLLVHAPIAPATVAG